MIRHLLYFLGLLLLGAVSCLTSCTVDYTQIGEDIHFTGVIILPEDEGK